MEARTSVRAKTAGSGRPAAKAAAPRAAARQAKAGNGAGGMINLSAVFSASGLAAELAKAADALTTAAESGEFCGALERNLELWVAIKTLAGRSNGQLDPESRDTLIRVADQVADATFQIARVFDPEAVLPFATIDLEVAQGLVNGALNRAIRERAYYLWLEAGAPHGEDQQFWYSAEREIRAALAA
jgi:hypothetical protein